MRINVRAEGFELRPQLRHAAVSHLLSALRPFRAHIELVSVRLSSRKARSQPETTICDVAVTLRPAGEVRARAEDARMDRAMTRASFDLRDAVEREVSRLQAPRRASHAVDAGPDALELVLHDNQISQQQRNRLERPENYLRPIRIREYWRPPGVQDDEAPQELELAASQPQR